MSVFDPTVRLASAEAITVKVVQSRFKRAFDVLAAGGALLVLAPLLCVVALAIFVEDGGPIFFRQRRTGLHGQVFQILKFRSMRVLDDGAKIRQATRGDGRVTRVGAGLRALSIDELPQFINILRGDMSLVGPRPHAVAHDEAWAQMVPGYAARFRTRPGLTGYAQICGFRGEISCGEQIANRVRADNHYIDNWSLRLEAEIVARTIPLLFNDPRAY